MEPDPGSRTMRIDILPQAAAAGSAGDTTRITAAGYDTTLVGRTMRHADPSSGYKKLLESVYDAVFITDSTGSILDFNTRATDFFRCSSLSLEGRQVTALISGGDESLISEINRNLDGRRYTLIEAYCLRKDRTLFPSEIAVNRINLTDDGQLCFFVRDTTVRKRAQDALEQAVQRLEEHDRARSQFVSNVSHELRTPLTSMIYAVTNLKKGVAGPVSEQLAKYLDVLDGDCHRLLRTVNDILDLRRLESDSLVLAKQKVPFGALVRRSAEAMRGLAERKMVQLDIKTGIDRWFVDCDPHRMERVVVNVVNNAVKFTPDGGRVRVSIADDVSAPGRVLLKVTDNGIGIPAEHLGRVTERYYTVGDQPAGTGLGLAISKEIVQVHGGTLSVISPPADTSRGTEVRVSMPLATPPTVMIVHGDVEVRNRVALSLEARGFRVSRPERTELALGEVERSRPDMVITDTEVPGTEAMEMVLKLKGLKELGRTPLMVVTRQQPDSARRQLLANLTVPLLAAPWEEHELQSCIETIFLG